MNAPGCREYHRYNRRAFLKAITADELGADRAGHRVEREPHATDLLSVDAIIRLILVPGAHLSRPRLFHQDVLVEDADPA